MTDATLAQLAKDAISGDEATLRALADRLADASAEDRLEAVRAWSRLAADLAAERETLRHARSSLSGNLTHNARAMQFHCSREIDDREAAVAPEAMGYYREECQHRIDRSIGGRLEEGRWYAVRRRVRVDRRDAAMRRTMIDARLDVVPLDGGQVLPVEPARGMR